MLLGLRASYLCEFVCDFGEGGSDSYFLQLFVRGLLAILLAGLRHVVTANGFVSEFVGLLRASLWRINWVFVF